ncbi:unnamed protein product [Protopolystoma xenopodis]|uniref:Uncharacterized protein n=1 Tax=Protopolystoma xenopodis TaxID=117903 RepID=A0A3S5AY06_9PLAT|nr:unnamed protein product [Protopolystoma xenopodis]VEL44039.1 unnamed protein product [Protopolystoma xenopodis]
MELYFDSGHTDLNDTSSCRSRRGYESVLRLLMSMGKCAGSSGFEESFEVQLLARIGQASGTKRGCQLCSERQASQAHARMQRVVKRRPS